MAMVEAAPVKHNEQTAGVDTRAVEALEAEVSELTGIETLNPDDFAKMQDKDPVMQKAKYHLAQQVKPTKSQLKSEPVKVKAWLSNLDRLQAGSDEVLRRSCKIPDGQKAMQVCLPPGLHHLVYEELHQKVGHLVSDRVIALAKDRFHWPGMAKDITHYVNKVCPCLKDKKPNQLRRAELQPIHTSCPFELVSIDYLHLQM